MVEAISKPINKTEQSFANGDGIDAIVQADASFSEKEFVKGAGMAYGMILEACRR